MYIYIYYRDSGIWLAVPDMHCGRQVLHLLTWPILPVPLWILCTSGHWRYLVDWRISKDPRRIQAVGPGWTAGPCQSIYPNATPGLGLPSWATHPCVADALKPWTFGVFKSQSIHGDTRRTRRTSFNPKTQRWLSHAFTHSTWFHDDSSECTFFSKVCESRSLPEKKTWIARGWPQGIRNSFKRLITSYHDSPWPTCFMICSFRSLRPAEQTRQISYDLTVELIDPKTFLRSCLGHIWKKERTSSAS